jgi:hypothetical protein
MPLRMEKPRLTPIPNFSSYGLCDNGQVWRLAPCTRGRYADRQTGPLRPSIHPRGIQWYVGMTRDDGKRIRMSLRKIWKLTFGEARECPVN